MNTSIITATIRQRGQLTIPDNIRAQCSWLSTDCVVSIQASDREKIVIEPIKAQIRSSTDWKKLRRRLARVGNYKGARGNLSDFIARDRHNH